jgi:hypothetical protein
VLLYQRSDNAERVFEFIGDPDLEFGHLILVSKNSEPYFVKLLDPILKAYEVMPNRVVTAIPPRKRPAKFCGFPVKLNAAPGVTGTRQ